MAYGIIWRQFCCLLVLTKELQESNGIAELLQRENFKTLEVFSKAFRKTFTYGALSMFWSGELDPYFWFWLGNYVNILCNARF